ncbi:MAG: hypothetical protein SF069_04230 [Phycisphaerae bacterium]|nr:hypothetical protein [Phycisphaerae bacterium]
MCWLALVVAGCDCLEFYDNRSLLEAADSPPSEAIAIQYLNDTRTSETKDYDFAINRYEKSASGSIGVCTSLSLDGSPIRFAAASLRRNGDGIAALADGRLVRFSVASPLVTVVSQLAQVPRAVAWSSDGTRVAMAFDDFGARTEPVINELRIATLDGATLASLPLTLPLPAKDPIGPGDGYRVCLSWSGDDARVAVSVSAWASVLRVLDFEANLVDVESGIIYEVSNVQAVHFLDDRTFAAMRPSDAGGIGRTLLLFGPAEPEPLLLASGRCGGFLELWGSDPVRGELLVEAFSFDQPLSASVLYVVDRSLRWTKGFGALGDRPAVVDPMIAEPLLVARQNLSECR